ncbi:actin monomer binding [Pyrenophora seminiperda CCB06]|uniref:Actin monomer binding n=1 Tax=Pyrenophora seminiperda CCB06 TaxID=1302712 RepID=A0A3M7MB66_9PLEO|nr:actin monomer binding [Pyrenophora seminiperda CCB06]
MIVRTAFTALLADGAYFALPLSVTGSSELQALPPLLRRDTSFQLALNQLDGVLTPVNSCYIVLRREKSLTFVTYVPYRANKNERDFFLQGRHECVRQLGEQHFVTSVICKEIGEVTDARSWDERDAKQESQDAVDDASEHTVHDNGKECSMDAGHKKNKCRLCDRRMKNKISPEALEALAQLHTPGATVQMSVNTSTETLDLRYMKNVPIADVAATLPADTPSFTFYRHPTTQLLYFIFHSPDSASVKERMMHTMAIPGLVNVHAEDQGVHVDQKIELHDPEDLSFEEKDERIGKFRSMYLRNNFEGTESKYDNLKADEAFHNAIQ